MLLNFLCMEVGCILHYIRTNRPLVFGGDGGWTCVSSGLDWYVFGMDGVYLIASMNADTHGDSVGTWVDIFVVSDYDS